MATDWLARGSTTKHECVLFSAGKNVDYGRNYFLYPLNRSELQFSGNTGLSLLTGEGT